MVFHEEKDTVLPDFQAEVHGQIVQSNLAETLDYHSGPIYSKIGGGVTGPSIRVCTFEPSFSTRGVFVKGKTRKEGGTVIYTDLFVNLPCYHTRFDGANSCCW